MKNIKVLINRNIIDSYSNDILAFWKLQGVFPLDNNKDKCCIVVNNNNNDAFVECNKELNKLHKIPICWNFPLPDLLNIFTDGSALSNGKKDAVGGFGVYIQQLSLLYGYKLFDTTNNRAELTAIIQALKFLNIIEYTKKVILISDSTYCINICDKWLANWIKNGKLKSKCNIDLLNLLIIEINQLKCSIIFKHIKAHQPKNVIRNPDEEFEINGNRIADQFATSNSC